MTQASDGYETLVSQGQLPKAIEHAKIGQTFIVRTWTFRQVAEIKAASMGREDLKFVVVKKELA